MAVVRITGELTDAVMQRVDRQFYAADEAAKRTRPEIGQQVYDIIMAPYRHDMDKVPASMFATIERMDIQLEGVGVHEAWALDNPMPAPYGLPREAAGEWGMGSYFSVTVKLRRNEKEFASVFEKVDAWQNAIAKVVGDRSAARLDVKKILDAFTTLAPALKAWPALWDLLPDGVRERHKQVVERAKPAAPKLDVSTDSLVGLTSKLVLERITKKAGE